MNTAMEPPVLLTTDEVAVLWKVHPRTVTRWTARGALPAVRVGNVTRYRAEDVDRLIQPIGSTRGETRAVPRGGPADAT